MAEEFVPVKETEEFEPIEESLLKRIAKGIEEVVVGVPQAGLAIASGMVAPVAGGMAGLASLPAGPEKAAEVTGKVQEALTYTPEYETGKKVAKIAALPFEFYGEKVVHPVGEAIAGEAPSQPRAALAALIEGALGAAPAALPLIKGKPGGAWSAAREQLGTGAVSAWDKYLNPTKFSPWDKTVRGMVGTIQLEGLKTLEFAKELQRRVPDRVSREAIANYIQAGGDEILLIERMGKSKPEYQAGYERATKLTPNEKVIADELHKRFDDNFKKAVDADILDDYIENYIPQISDRATDITKRLYAEHNSGMLLKNPRFAKKRLYESYFDLEQAGRIPKNKDVAYLLQDYEHALAKSVATRAMVKELMEGVASDGRPLAHVAGYARTLASEDVLRAVGKGGKPLESGELIEALQRPEVQARFIRPKGRLEDFFDYKRPPDNPAFRKWKWIDADEAGKPSFLEGEIYLHPEIAQKVSNVFTPSALRKYWPTRMLLKGAANLKGVLLSFSGFHQVQVAEHAIFHKVNPIKVPKIDFNDPLTAKLVKAGTVVFDHMGENFFAEGLASTGLVNKIPGIGSYMQKYTNYLFRDYIPRIKVRMAQEAYNRNRAISRYKHLSDDQVAMLTADQANAAFGELNYAALGRNRTLQDFLRLTLLAPDFLEARFRFAGQAMRPYGQEQLMAAGVRGTLMYYTGARIINALLNDGDPKWDKPFSVIINNRDYSLRTVPGDVWHLVSDPRSFAMHRLNPTITRTAIEAGTQRNYMGRWRSWEDQFVDFFQSHTPIPSQDLFNKLFGSGPGKRNARWWDSIMSAWGIVAKEERSQALQKALEVNRRSAFAPVTKIQEKQSRVVQNYVDQIQEARRSNDPIEMDKVKAGIKADAQAGKLNVANIKKIMKNAANSPLQNALKPMAVENALYVWEFMSPQEKYDTAGIIMKKFTKLPKDRLDAIQEQIRAFSEELKRLNASKELTKTNIGTDTFEEVLEAERAK